MDFALSPDTQRHRSGAESSLELALTAHIVPELEWEILDLTEAA